MWKTVKLGDVCQIVNGGTPKSKVPDYWNGDIDWLTPKDMGKLPSRYINNTERAITQDGLENSSAKLIPSGSVLLSCRAPIGHTGINPKPISFNQGCKGLIPDNEVIAEYLYYFLFASKKLLNDLGSGTTFKEISSKTLSQVPIPLPPLSEQKRIIERLDKAFAEIDKAIATAEAKEGEIERLKAATLSAMLDRGSQSGESITEDEEHSVMWETFRLGEIASFVRGLTYSKKDEVETDGIPVLRATNIDLKRHKIVLDDIRLIRGSLKVSAEKFIRKGDLLICTASGSKSHLGKVALIERDIEFAFGGFMAAIRLNKHCDPRFIYYSLTSREFKSHLDKVSDGTNINNLKFSQIEDFEIYLPPLSEQKRIVERLDKAFAEIEIVGDRTQSCVENYAALKASILKQELTPSEAV